MGFSDDERMSLLAHCVSLTANAIRAPRQCADESEANAAVLAREVGLDMVAYWQPTAASYFGRASKERIVKTRSEAQRLICLYCPWGLLLLRSNARTIRASEYLNTLSASCFVRLVAFYLKPSNMYLPKSMSAGNDDAGPTDSAWGR
jgi:hypothetical protein